MPWFSRLVKMHGAEHFKRLRVCSLTEEADAGLKGNMLQYFLHRATDEKFGQDFYLTKFCFDIVKRGRRFLQWLFITNDVVTRAAYFVS